MTELRSPHQTGSLDALREKSKNSRRLLIVLPTGTGKTVVFANLMDYLGLTNKLMVIVHTDELANQAADKIRHWNPGKKVGIEMGASVADRDCDVVVASAQTLGRNNSARIIKWRPEDFDCVVVDEAHHAVASTYQRIFKHFGLDGAQENGRILVGVTATPDRGDGVALNAVFDEIAYQYSLIRAIRDGWLVTPRGLTVRNKSRLDSVQTRAGDFAQDQLSKEVNTQANNILCVEGWKKQGEQRQTLVFCVDIQHAKDLAAEFNKAGVSAEAVWGNDPDRQTKLRNHRDKHFKVLCNCQVLTEGYDDWQIGHIIVNRPTKSRGLYMQMIGRGLRLQDGIGNMNDALKRGVNVHKRDCIVQDMVGAATRHSIITLATLAGMSQKVDLKGKTLLEVQDELDEIKEQRPDMDPLLIEDVGKLNVEVQHVDLMATAQAPPVVQFSEYQWRKTGEAYVLLLTNGEDVVVRWSERLDAWAITGQVKGRKFQDQSRTLEGAIESADNIVRSMAGRGLLTKISRDPGSQIRLATNAAKTLARQVGVVVEIGMTQAEITKAIQDQINRRRA